MSESKEGEKLTQSLRKSYDGDSTLMAENSETENNNEPQDEDEKTRKKKEAKAAEEGREEQDSEESNSKLVDVLCAIFFVDEETTSDQKEAIAGAYVDFVIKDAEVKGDNVEEKIANDIAELLFIERKHSDERTPHTSNEELAEISASNDLFLAIFKAADKADLNTKAIATKLANIEKKEPPIEAEDRFDKLDEYFKKHVDMASDEALEVLREQLGELAQATDERNDVHAPAEKAASVLEDIIEEVEGPPDAPEKNDADEEFEKAYAEMLVRVFDAMPNIPLAPEENDEVVIKETFELQKQHKVELGLMVRILAPKDEQEYRDTPEDRAKKLEKKLLKEKAIAALLRQHFQHAGEGDEIGKNEAIRNEIFRLAGDAGLDTTTIEAEEIHEETDIIQVSELEEAYFVNDFEGLVEKQIIAAEPEDVEKIRDAWKELLAKADPDSDIADEAQKAIVILGDIIHFKKEVRKAHAKDKNLSHHDVAPPRTIEPHDGRKKERDDTDSSEEQNAQAKAKLTPALFDLLSQVNPGASEEDKVALQIIVQWIFASQASSKDKEKALKTLLASFPLKGEAMRESAIHGQITEIALGMGIVTTEDINDVQPVRRTQEKPKNTIQKEPQEALKELIAETVNQGPKENLQRMQGVWEQMLQYPLRPAMKRDLTKAVSQIETIVRTNQDLTREEAIVSEETNKGKYAEAVSEIFIARPYALESMESEAIAVLVQTVTMQYINNPQAQKDNLAEKEIAKLLLAFPGKGKNGEKIQSSEDMRKLIFERAEALGLQNKEIYLEFARLSKHDLFEGSEATIFSRKDELEQLVKNGLERATSEERMKLQTMWEHLATAASAGAVQKYAGDAVKALKGVAHAEKELAKGEPAEPPIEKKKSRKEQSGELVDRIEALKKHAASVTDKELRGYLEELAHKIDEGLTAEETAAALQELHQRVQETDASSDKEGAEKRKIEKATTPFRKYLSGSLAEYEELELAQKVLSGEIEVTQESVHALLDETEAINHFNDYSELTPERFKNYAQKLKEILISTHELSDEQLKAVYVAFKTQATILGIEAENQALHGKAANEYRKVQEETQLAVQKLVNKIMQSSKSNVTVKEVVGANGKTNRPVMNAKDDTQGLTGEVREYKMFSQMDKAAQSNVERYREQSGFSRQMEEKAAYTPVPTAQMDAYGRKGPKELYTPEGDSASELLQTSASVSSELSSRTDPPPVTADIQQELQRVSQSMQSKEVYADITQIDQKREEIKRLETEYHTRISNAIQNNNSDEVVSLRNIPGLQQLASGLMKQRNVLAQMQGYEGLIQTASEMDQKLYGGYIHEALGERMRRIRVELESGVRQGTESYSNEDMIKYYKELQRWATILLSNDVRRNPANAKQKDALKLSNQRYERFSEIAGRKITAINAASSQDMLNDIKYMLNDSTDTGGDFLRYFKQNAPDPKNAGELLGVKYQRPEDQGNYQPESLQATMQEIAAQYGADFQTGGKRELINSEGEFMYHNFNYWIRRKINEDVDYNKDGQIQPFGKIIIKLDMGQISMYELLLLIPQYTSQRKFDIRMQDGEQGEVYSGWGDKVEDPSFKWKELDLIAMEMEFRTMTHELRMQFTATSVSNNKEQYLGLMKKLHHNNHWTRASNVFLVLGYASGSVDNAKDEFDAWKGDETEKQGSLGKSMSDMLVQYNYLSELTDYYETKTDKDGNPSKQKREKTFNENMFYRFLEPNGANRFLIKMAEGALGYNNDAKSRYAEFIGGQIESVAADYIRSHQDKRKGIELLRDEWMQKALSSSPEVNFTANEQFKNFLTLVERNELKTGITDKEIDQKIQENLVSHLQKGYFDKLKTMTVGTIAKDAKGKDRKSTNRLLMTDGTIQFGEVDVEVGDGQTMKMKDFLDSFDVDQILRFDYSNDKSDQKNPFRRTADANLRRAIDGFMDPDVSPENYKLFKKNEQMMLAFTKHVTRIDRKDLNHFRDAEELEYSRDMIRRAFQHVSEKTYGIDNVESEYAWWWVRDYVYLWGIGASLDCDGIGFRWDGKIMNPGKWRPRRQGKDGGGNPHTFDEFMAMSMPFLHHMQVSNTSQSHEPLGHRSIFSWLQGGEGGKITPRALREFDKRSNYTFQQNAEALYADNTLDNSSELIELLSKTEFDVTGIVSFDVLGNVVYDYAKARDIFGKWRKAARYAYGKNGLDYRSKIWVNGREKTLYEHFFGPKTRALNELIFRKTGREIDFMYKDPADAVMMSIVGAEIAEHRAVFGAGHHWTIENVLEFEKMLLDFMTEFEQSEDEQGVMKSKPKVGTLFNHKIFAGALKAYHTSYYKMYASELNSTFWSGLFSGIGEGIEEFFTEGKWIW